MPGTQIQLRVRQDAMAPYLMQGNFLLMEEYRGGVQGHLGCEEGHLVLNEGPSKSQPGLQRDLCHPASVQIAIPVSLEWFLGWRDNPCCAQSAPLGS